MTQVATIVAAKQHPLALITSANGDKLQFAPVDSGLRTVGAPVGDPQYRTDWYKEYLSDKIQPTLDAIKQLAQFDDENGAQSAFALLRHSASHKFTHLLRAAPPSLINEAAQAYDAAIIDCLAHILDHSAAPTLFSEGTSPSASTQAALPTNLGSLGLSSAQLVSQPAYLASWIDFLRFGVRAAVGAANPQ